MGSTIALLHNPDVLHKVMRRTCLGGVIGDGVDGVIGITSLPKITKQQSWTVEPYTSVVCHPYIAVTRSGRAGHSHVAVGALQALRRVLKRREV
jgi:hypothetical protein